MKIPTTVITGFLGVGKTTLIRDVLASANGRRIALVINEFGELPIDGDLLKGCGLEDCSDDDVVELANGCICCTVAEDFLPTMKKLIERDHPPEQIVIETSGLALPQPLVRAFRWPEIRTRVGLDGVIAVVDGRALAEGEIVADRQAVSAQREADPNLDHESGLDELLDSQLEAADLLVVTKTDLLDGAGLARAMDFLKGRLRPGTPILSSGQKPLTADLLLGLGAGAALETIEPEHGDRDDDDHDHHHPDFAAHVVSIPEQEDISALTKAVESAMTACGAYRVKGVVSVAGRDMRLVVQGVGRRVQTHFDRDWNDNEERQSRLVFIAPGALDEAALGKTMGL